ncbi:TPA: hypothetical protein N0F65_010400 [Lagenidium giganteum]|uniref:Glycoside hydrolase family 5 domain-containing protein n=1 Tax=Lagenidium giganteum TaxID=4803 RepID=A0AAV2YVF4_9STRA|nr:TPA: hypothetical protein N0F65_010400 [Lagenidium giganteum]
MWDNDNNGTTADHIVEFLSENKFNAVRLPVMVSAILDNKKPNTKLINSQTNPTISVDSYLGLLQSIVSALQFRKIGVLISMHTLTADTAGKVWFQSGVLTEKEFLGAIDTLTSKLCTEDYWNILGIDIKNEPFGATWGDGSDTDFRDGAQRIANRMFKGCDRWMGFVEGINGRHSLTVNGDTFEYGDWYGGGLQGAKKAPVEFTVEDKLVWAPHYYTPAVYPQPYLYKSSTAGDDGVLTKYVELDDDTLFARVESTMKDMFGFLASSSSPALVLGEFGGLYAEDKHPKKTAKRCTDYTIKVMTSTEGYAGGFVWSLNPESLYAYNPADTKGSFYEGLVDLTWMRANDEYLEALSAMDSMPNLAPLPCFKRNATKN